MKNLNLAWPVILSLVLFLSVPRAHCLAEPIEQIRVLLLELNPRLNVISSMSGGSGLPSSARVTLLSERTVMAVPEKRRALRLSVDRIVIIGLDAANRELWRFSRPDPRLVRAEFPNAAGELSGQEFYYDKATLSLALPSEPRLRQLRLLKPRWTGRSFAFDEIDTLIVPQR